MGRTAQRRPPGLPRAGAPASSENYQLCGLSFIKRAISRDGGTLWRERWPEVRRPAGTGGGGVDEGTGHPLRLQGVHQSPAPEVPTLL